MQARVIMLVDLDYFFAQCEERRNPSLKDKPVVVCVYSGRSEDSGAVSTANYIARKYGVTSGIPIFLAKKKLKKKDAVFLPVDHEFYEEVSGKIMRILRSHADLFEQVGIDEAYLDVSQKVKGSLEEAKELAQRIKEEVKAQQKLTCSIGIGPNKLVAKIAADIQKPDGLTIVKPEQVESFLSPLPVSRLIGVGRKTKKKMQTLGIRTIGDLAKYNVQRLIEVFGKKLGIYFHNASIGLDDEPVQERGEVESISRISTLKEDTRDLKVIVEKTNQLCDEVHAKLVQRELGFKSVGIVAVMVDMSVRSRSKTLENPTNELEVLKKTVKELFEKFLNESELGIRRVGVRVSNFVKEQERQKQITNFIGLAKN
ncbi:MAG: DNA polymerase IV [Candidatus Bathyarchaeota archaeon]|nr:DNA polymerase IV [Candidatus Bathyarchaeota archaeon]